MKRTGIFLLLSCLTLTFVSCKKKGCIDEFAENYDTEAEKDDGSCTYLSDKLLGTYTVNQNCYYGGSTTYSMNVIEGSNKGEVILQGLYA